MLCYCTAYWDYVNVLHDMVNLYGGISARLASSLEQQLVQLAAVLAVDCREVLSAG